MVVLPERDVEGESINCVFMTLQLVEEGSCFGLPDLTSSIVAARDKPR